MPPRPIFFSSPLRHRPLPSSRHRPLPSSRHRPLPPISSSFPSTLFPLPDTCSLSAPPSSPAPVLSDLHHPLPFGTVQPNKTERKASVRSCLAKQRAFVRACLVERRAMAEQRPFVRPYLAEWRPSVLANQDRTEALCSVLFGRTVPEGREALGAGEGRYWKAGEERRERAGAREWEEGYGEGDGDGREGTVPKRRKGVVLERRCLRKEGQGVWREKKKKIV